MRAVIYVRYSSDNQSVESIEAQSRAIKEYCKNNNIEIVKIYADEARSATTDNRPNFLQMFKEVPRLNVQSVIVHKLDRFARNRYDSAFYRKKLKEDGIKLISVLENLDDSPESIILESMLEGMAEYYSRNLSREVMKGMKETALKGKHNGGIPPLGLDVAKDKTYVLNESEALIIKHIFELYLDGHGYKKIATTLNSKGYRTKMNRDFSQTSIRDILVNEKYTGTYVFNRRADGKTLTKLKPQEEIIKVPDVLPVIILKEIFERVAINMGNRKKSVTNKIHKNLYLLTGKLFCGECGAAYTGNSYRGKTKQYIYTCTNKKNKDGCNNKDVSQDKIEGYVIEELKSNIFSENSMEEIISRLLKYVDEKDEYVENERKIAEDKIKEINRKIDKLFDLYLDDHLDKNILSKKIEAQKEELNFYENKKNELLFVDTGWITEDKVKSYFSIMRDNLYSEDKKLIKKVIDYFTHEIYIYDDKIETTLKLEGGQSHARDMVGGGEPYLTISLTCPRFLKDALVDDYRHISNPCRKIA